MVTSAQSSHAEKNTVVPAASQYHEGYEIYRSIIQTRAITSGFTGLFEEESPVIEISRIASLVWEIEENLARMESMISHKYSQGRDIVKATIMEGLIDKDDGMNWSFLYSQAQIEHMIDTRMLFNEQISLLNEYQKLTRESALNLGVWESWGKK